MGAHDSFSTSTNPFALSRDQRISLSDQLSMGIRLLQGQGHARDGIVHLCHTSCMLFDGGSVQDYLATVKAFLDVNPNEVVTILFTNPEELSVEDYWHPAFVASGIAELAFVPADSPIATSEWPTLQNLITSGKRVIVFMDKGTNSATVPYIISEFEHIWETPYSVTDPTFPCKLDRIAGSPEHHMYLINHSLNMAIKLPFASPIIVPNLFQASVTNGIESILRHAEACKSIPESGGRCVSSFFDGFSVITSIIGPQISYCLTGWMMVKSSKLESDSTVFDWGMSPCEQKVDIHLSIVDLLPLFVERPRLR